MFTGVVIVANVSLVCCVCSVCGTLFSLPHGVIDRLCSLTLTLPGHLLYYVLLDVVLLRHVMKPASAAKCEPAKPSLSFAFSLLSHSSSPPEFHQLYPLTAKQNCRGQYLYFSEKIRFNIHVNCT